MACPGGYRQDSRRPLPNAGCKERKGRVSAPQDFVLSRVVVPAAARLGLEEEYAYLRPSIEAFPTGREQERLALEAGFKSAVHYPLSGGLMGCLVVTK